MIHVSVNILAALDIPLIMHLQNDELFLKHAYFMI